MQRIKCYYSGMMTVLMAALMCVSMSACGGGSDDDFDGIDIDRNIDNNQPSKSGRRTKGVHQVDVSFSGNYDGWDLKVYFISADKDGAETKLYYDGQEMEQRFYVYNEYHDYSVKTTDQAYVLICEVTLTRKSADALPVKVNMSTKVDDNFCYSEEYETDSKYSKITYHFCSQIPDNNKIWTKD